MLTRKNAKINLCPCPSPCLSVQPTYPFRKTLWWLLTRCPAKWLPCPSPMTARTSSRQGTDTWSFGTWITPSPPRSVCQKRTLSPSTSDPKFVWPQPTFFLLVWGNSVFWSVLIPEHWSCGGFQCGGKTCWASGGFSSMPVREESGEGAHEMHNANDQSSTTPTPSCQLSSLRCRWFQRYWHLIFAEKPEFLIRYSAANMLTQHGLFSIRWAQMKNPWF